MGQVTLGGERLGSGNRMKVDMHGFERSTHDLSYIWRSTMAAGTLVPFLKEVALPGDTFDIHLNCDIKTHPTIGPLFGSYKVQLDVFCVPMRLYQSGLHNNMLGIGLNMSQIKFPKIRLLARPVNAQTEDMDNAQINSSCILSYLGIRGVGIVNPVEGLAEPQYRKFNAIPLLAYWDIYKNYYANKQEEEGVVIAQDVPVISSWVTGFDISGNSLPEAPMTNFNYLSSGQFVQISFVPGPAPDLSTVYVNTNSPQGKIALNDFMENPVIDETTGTIWGYYDFARWGNLFAFNYAYLTVNDSVNNPPRLLRFDLNEIDNMRQQILASPYNTEFIVNDSGLEPYVSLLRVIDLEGADYATMQSNQEGLGIKTYQSDLFNNWLSTEWIDGVGGINEITAVDTSGGSFTIDAIQLAKKVYDMLNRIAVSGGTYDDWLNAVYDHDAYNRAESPVYMGGLIKELVFQEVVSNAQTDTTDGQQPLGTLAGKGVMGQKHKGGDVIIRVDEPSYIMGIISLTPRIDYSQGNKWDVTLDTLDDLHKPSLDQIGFQELVTEQMAWFTTRKPIAVPAWEQKSAGKQPAWINYMTNVNEVRGNFAVRTNEMFMTLTRRYEPEQIGVDYSNFTIGDLTTYIDPVKFNHIFAQTSIDAQNFWTQISVDMTVRRKMSAKVMPNL